MAKQPKLNRRDFLKRTATAAGAAAIPGLPSIPVPELTKAAGLDPSSILSPALERGFDTIYGQIVSNGKDAMLWGGDLENLSKSEVERLKAVMTEARERMPLMPEGKFSYYNTLTKQWHQRAAVPLHGSSPGQSNQWKSNPPPDNISSTPWLKAGQSPPDGLEYAGGRYQPWMDEDFASSAYTDGTLTKPGLPFLNHTGIPGPARNQIDSLLSDWRAHQRQLKEFYRQNRGESPEAEQRYIESLADLGLTPGGRYEEPAIAQDSGLPTGQIGLPGSESSSGSTGVPRTGRLIRSISRTLPAAVIAGAASQQQEAEAAPRARSYASIKAAGPQLPDLSTPESFINSPIPVPNYLSLRDLIAPYYANVPGGIEAAMANASKNMEGGVPGIGSYLFTKYDTNKVNDPLLVTQSDDKDLLGEYLHKAFYPYADDPNLAGRIKISPSALEKNPRITLQHEAGHHVFAPPELDQAIALANQFGTVSNPSPDQIRDVSRRIKDLSDDAMRYFGHGPQWRGMYYFKPSEIDARLPNINREFARATGQLIDSPEKAMEAMDFYAKNEPFTVNPDLSDELLKTYTEDPAIKSLIAKRIPQLLALGGVGMASTQAQAGENSPIDAWTKGQSEPIKTRLDDQTTMTGATADQTLRTFARPNDVSARHDEVLRGIIEQRMLPWLGTLQQPADAQTIKSAFNSLRGLPTTPEGKSLSDQFLNHMQSISYGGDSAPDASVTQGQYKQWQQEAGGPELSAIGSTYGEGAANRVTPAGKQMFNNQRDYEFLRTFQEGVHAPGYQTSFYPYAASAVGQFLDPTLETRNLFLSRDKGGPQGRMEEALYWYDQSDPAFDKAAGQPDRYKGGLMGSRYSDLSPLTSKGFNETVSNSDNPVGVWFTGGELAARGPFTKLFTQPLSTVQAIRDMRNQMTVNNNSGRPVPILPDTDPTLGANAMLDNEAARQHQQKQASAYAPQILPYLGMKPSYLSPAGEFGANFIGDVLADPGTAFGLGKAAILNTIKAPTLASKAMAPLRTVGNYARYGLPGEMPTESVTNATLYQTQQDPMKPTGLFEAEESNPNVVMGGMGIKADDPRYQQAYDQGIELQRQRLNRIGQAARAYRVAR